MFHHVRNDLAREYSTPPGNLDELLDYIEEKNIEIKTISGVLDLGCHL